MREVSVALHSDPDFKHRSTLSMAHYTCHLCSCSFALLCGLQRHGAFSIPVFPAVQAMVSRQPSRSITF